MGLSMLTTDMPRKRTTITIDEEAIRAIKDLATDVGATFPRYLEKMMIEHAKEKGKLPSSYVPLGETRGGDRTQVKEEET